MTSKKLVLEDGSVFCGTGFGADTQTVFEVVFNTSMTGYQEILSDPSYTDQGIVFSYPLIGNYGIATEDFESRIVSPSAVIVRDINDNPSNFRSVETAGQLLWENGIPGITGVDTRRLVRKIRDGGCQRAMLADADLPVEEALLRIAETPVPHDAVRRRSCRRIWYSRTAHPKYHVVLIDCGMKMNILRDLSRQRCNVTIVPFDTPAEEILAMTPDGVLISNGPGDPADVPEVIETLQKLRGRLPLFGICLGHQLLALSCGASTYKLKFGHRGGNHPVMDVWSGKIEMTSQNHSYAVDESSLRGTGLAITHRNVLDGTVEGQSANADGIFSVQYHPESAPGPCDSGWCFDHFAERMSEWKAPRLF